MQSFKVVLQEIKVHTFDGAAELVPFYNYFVKSRKGRAFSELEVNPSHKVESKYYRQHGADAD